MTDIQFEDNIELILHGSKDGLKTIYDEYVKIVFSLVFCIMGHQQDAEDVTSDVFIKLWDKAETYHFGGKHKPWIMAIARNTAIDALRKENHIVAIDEMEEPEEEIQSSLESQICNKIPLENACSHLNPVELQIVTMHVLGDISFKDLSKIFQKPLGTVAWIYRKAINKLRRYDYD
nr:sigma-70 family RNA polymerase sigma factor [uncultured Caproiciproducens sp.]